MKKIKKLIKSLFLILKQPSLLNIILDDESVNKQIVTQKYGLPKGLKTIEITDLIPEFNLIIFPFSSIDGGSTPLDLALLKGLAIQINNCSYFEIGTYRGESVANVASTDAQCVTLNLPDLEMRKMGLSEDYINSHRCFSKDIKNITHLQANSQTFDFSEYYGKFDLVFVDGDHHFECVKKDSETAFKLLKNEKSIIVWHDYGTTPSDIRWDVLRGIVAGTDLQNQKNLFHVSNTLCAIYTSQTYQSDYYSPYISLKKIFSLDIKIMKE